jgi:hypothetical protein
VKLWVSGWLASTTKTLGLQFAAFECYFVTGLLVKHSAAKAIAPGFFARLPEI